MALPMGNVVLFVVAGYGIACVARAETVEIRDAPFEMPVITVPEFAEREFGEDRLRQVPYSIMRFSTGWCSAILSVV